MIDGTEIVPGNRRGKSKYRMHSPTLIVDGGTIGRDIALALMDEPTGVTATWPVITYETGTVPTPRTVEPLVITRTIVQTDPRRGRKTPLGYYNELNRHQKRVADRAERRRSSRKPL